MVTRGALSTRTGAARVGCSGRPALTRGRCRASGVSLLWGHGGAAACRRRGVYALSAGAEAWMWAVLG